MRKLAAGVALVVLLAACSGGDDAPPPKPVLPAAINISGDVAVTGATYVRGNLADCAGAGPYADMIIGAPVTVSNGQGKPLAIGKIQYSVGTNVYRNQLDQCVFRYGVAAVPRATNYLVTIGRQPPRATTFAYVLATGGIFTFNLAAPSVPTTTTLGSLNPVG